MCVCACMCARACVHSCFEEKENIEAILKGKHRSHQHCPIVLGCLRVGPPNSHHCLWLYGPSTRCPPRSQGSWLCSPSHPWASVTPAADTTSPPTFTKVVSVHGAAGGSVPRPGAPREAHLLPSTVKEPFEDTTPSSEEASRATGKGGKPIIEQPPENLGPARGRDRYTVKVKSIFTPCSGSQGNGVFMCL